MKSLIFCLILCLPYFEVSDGALINYRRLIEEPTYEPATTESPNSNLKPLNDMTLLQRLHYVYNGLLNWPTKTQENLTESQQSDRNVKKAFKDQKDPNDWRHFKAASKYGTRTY